MVRHEVARDTSGDIHAKGLKDNTIGLGESIVMGLASTAPAYSLAATLGFIVIVVGVQAPIAIILAFVPMLFTAIAYREMNRAVPDCGTTFTWGTKAFGPIVGWMGGWGVAIAGIIVLANLAQVAGQYLYFLIGADGLAENEAVVTATGVGFIAVMTFVSWRGIDVSARIQNVLLAIQYAALLLFVIVALVKAYGGAPPEGSVTPSLGWFNPFGFDSLSGFTEAILLAIFIYWGWDTCLAINEETTDSDKTPGRAAVISTVLLLATYTLVTVAALAYAGAGDTGLGLANEDIADDVFSPLADSVLGSWAWVVLLAIVVSAASSTQTTILPTARGTLAMAAYKALPRQFGTVHPVYKTPSFSTLVMGVVASVYYIGLTIISDNILADSILSLGLAIAFYYAVVAFSCVRYFRKQIFTSARSFLILGLVPLLGGLMLTAAFIKSAIDMTDPEYGYTVLFGVGGAFVLGIGVLLLGVVLMMAWYATQESKPFFNGETLNDETPVLVPEDE
jgi:amino acid transporter